jgi:hypothetical protein
MDAVDRVELGLEECRFFANEAFTKFEWLLTCPADCEAVNRFREQHSIAVERFTQEQKRFNKMIDGLGDL